MQHSRLHFDVLELQQYYHLPLKEVPLADGGSETERLTTQAARELGICEAALKRICRRNHIMKWPYRQVQSVLKRIEVEVHLRKRRREAREGSAFLLPHEIDRRRKHVHDDDGMLRLHQLHLEMQEIIEKAHVPDGELEKDKIDEPYDLTRESSPPSIIMTDAIDVDANGRPLDLLATLCATESSRRGVQKPKLSARASLQDKHVEVASMEMEIHRCKIKQEPIPSV